MPNPTQEPAASSKAQSGDLKDTDDLCTFKIKIESQNSDIGLIKTSDYIKINLKISNPSEEPPVSSKTQNQDLKDMGLLCTFEIKIDSYNFGHGCIKDHWPYTNQDQDP